MTARRTTVIDNIGLLVTNDPTIGRGPLGIVENASVVFDDVAVVAAFNSQRECRTRGVNDVIPVLRANS